MIDELRKGKGSFIHRLTKASKSVLDEEIKKAMDESGLTKQAKALQKREEEIKQMKIDADARRKEEERLRKEQRDLEEKTKRLEEEAREAQKRAAESESGGRATEEMENSDNGGGGCYPASAIVCDIGGRRRRMDSLKIGEEVQVIISNEIRFEPVITFIHHQPDVMQEFLKITTIKNNALKITEDHLLFIEKMGQVAAIPARNLEVGDTVYVRGKHSVEMDAVQSISTVYEKGVYAPVTLSGTILVNDVHTSCYFDVLSHEWSHKAMGVARAVHYVSPWMLQWISGVGQKDGFPGWCRLAHKMLTLFD